MILKRKSLPQQKQPAEGLKGYFCHYYNKPSLTFRTVSPDLKNSRCTSRKYNTKYNVVPQYLFMNGYVINRKSDFNVSQATKSKLQLRFLITIFSTID